MNTLTKMNQIGLGIKQQLQNYVSIWKIWMLKINRASKYYFLQSQIYYYMQFIPKYLLNLSSMISKFVAIRSINSMFVKH